METIAPVEPSGRFGRWCEVAAIFVPFKASFRGQILVLRHRFHCTAITPGCADRRLASGGASCESERARQCRSKIHLRLPRRLLHSVEQAAMWKPSAARVALR